VSSDTLEIGRQTAGEELPAHGCWDWQSCSCEEALRVAELVAGEMAQQGYPQGDCFAMKLALDEAISNAVRHGNRGNPAKLVHVRVHLDRWRVLAEVEDEGEGFDPEDVPDPREPEALHRPGGRGLLLMRHFATWLLLHEPGNRVTLCRCRSEVE
jgi:serine/threonine-protein kinase RsbW